MSERYCVGGIKAHRKSVGAMLTRNRIEHGEYPLSGFGGV